ncbi:uncharacterized protein Z518_03204 [Rhinocladiella mackenziei CBS 650.93]|uniref:Palmitoyltransferase n=1 Tax=Rhinocladiella mackenziei CBS 650.93 TaxID=1442369 RepID=A0A0D2HDG6_9EURO|nr:uncharacterized protein Z518_03204 [Rhinocladiella mackenziei CBS 650.93]KIX08548.1 hypothetical protein Z518_03204 [Rhinocladiella mackenziei CBS 650.93]
MASYSTPSSSPPPTPSGRRLRICARNCERACCTVATYFPLAFVYGLTTWAVWVVTTIGFGKNKSKHVWWLIQGVSLLGIILYGLANLSYTIAAFTDPGSPLNSATDSPNQRQGRYSMLPTNEPSGHLGDIQNITVSSTGAPRYCKKCHTPKPDRTHHCSTCKRCVLKMDHHCPWLSTCLGLHNYKAFVLFLIYTSLFCWVCFANSAWWMWKELFEQSGYLEEVAPVNIILLSVVAGIIGLVLTGFTGWHIYLCVKGQTTIEKLEKTRYLSGIRSRVERNRQEQQFNHHRRTSEGVAERLQRAGEQILEFHANAVPGASRYEEGEEHTSPVPRIHKLVRPHPPYPQHPNFYTDDHVGNDNSDDTPALRALRRAYSSIEAERERDRYAEYLDEHESEKMPNAFDLGWRRNLKHLFGPNPLLWWLPVCNTTGDGWRWEVSEKWKVAHEEAGRRKERRLEAMMDQPGTASGHGVRIRGGAGPGWYERDRHGDYGHSYDSRSAMFMKTLNHNHNPTQAQQWAGEYPPSDSSGEASDRGRRRHRRDFDQAEPNGQLESFQVSSSSSNSTSDDDNDEDSDSDIGYDDDRAERGWERRNRASIGIGRR